MKKIRLYSVLVILISVIAGCAQHTETLPAQMTMSKDELRDKIKGGWAGQTIGVALGGPYEFRFNGTWIQDYQPLIWHEGYVKKTMVNRPQLFDDVYVDLTFVEVFEEEGFDSPVSSFANAFADKEYMLWHANQAARYNLQNGIEAPESGHWKNNPHAQDIDYQIEADYAGLMSPGMPNAASEISDKIGHIMNYGEGWYGGVFVGAMYSLAFVSDDVNYIVEEALKTVPENSEFYRTINDVVQWHRQYPDDWLQTWFEIQKKYSEDEFCPIGVHMAFNINAKLNSAYVVLGLLYGDGDYTRSLEISTRAGQDNDCNPGTVGGVLGVMMGYENIPDYWKKGLDGAEDIDFAYTSISLNDIYEIGFEHALQNLERNDGMVEVDKVTIPIQKPEAVRYEEGFPGLKLVGKKDFQKRNVESASFSFTGSGFVLRGEARKKNNNFPEYTFEAELYIDGVLVETVKLPTDIIKRRLELFWNYELEEGEHEVEVRVLNPDKRYEIRTEDIIIYSKSDI